MKHKLKINVANDSPKEGIVACKKKKVRRGLLILKYECTISSR